MVTPQLPDDLNPAIIEATATLIGKVTGLVPPPTNAFPPEWYEHLRAFTNRVYEIARENGPSDAAQAPDAWQFRFRSDDGRAWSKWLLSPDSFPERYKADPNYQFRPLHAGLIAPAAADAAQARPASIALLAADHTGMRVDYSGVFRQATAALARGLKEPGLAEMLRQLKEHITELGVRWYAGDTTVVDELLQLYCVENGARDALVTGGKIERRGGAGACNLGVGCHGLGECFAAHHGDSTKCGRDAEVERSDSAGDK